MDQGVVEQILGRLGKGGTLRRRFGRTRDAVSLAADLELSPVEVDAAFSLPGEAIGDRGIEQSSGHADLPVAVRQRTGSPTMRKLFVVILLASVFTAATVFAAERPPVGTEGPDMRATESRSSSQPVEGIEGLRDAGRHSGGRG